MPKAGKGNPPLCQGNGRPPWNFLRWAFLNWQKKTCQDNVRTLMVRVNNKQEPVMSALRLPKNERIDVRTSSSVKMLLQEAARVTHKNVSEFLLDVGIAAANQALADQRLFSLDDTQWAAFEKALDRPVQDKPRLKELLSTPGLLECK
jgi:uncharacterized protein (DUF1778 family)